MLQFNRLIGCLTVASIIALSSTQALAMPSFAFNGDYLNSDSADAGTFREILTFSNVTISPVAGDPVLGDANKETISISPFTLDQTFSQTIIGPPAFPAGTVVTTFGFSPTTYTDGFKVFESAADGGSLIFEGDLEVVSLVSIQSGATFNNAFNVNLTNITFGAGYSAGASSILDAFVNPPSAGMVNATLQFAGTNLANSIINAGGTDGSSAPSSTFSGNAAAVPEPGTMLLMGSGLLGLGLWRNFKK